MKTITITVSNRPFYLKRLIECLYNVSEINTYTVIFSLEPICEESKLLCETSQFKNKIILYNKNKLGVRDHPYTLLNQVFSYSDLNIYLEEDIIVSKDIIHLSNFYNEHNDHLLLNLYNKNKIGMFDEDILDVQDKFINGNNIYFSPFAWITSKNHWNNHLSKWWYIDDKGWDFSVVTSMEQFKKRMLITSICRCNHIGEIGTHVTKEYNDLHFSNTIISNNEDKINYRIQWIE
jgi:hypothetical protein